MIDQIFGPRLAVKENAMPTIAQIRDQLADAVIAIVDNPPDACCQIGFQVVPVSRSEMPEKGFDRIGIIDGLEVAAESGLLPFEHSKVVLGFDRETGTLIAYVDH